MPQTVVKKALGQTTALATTATDLYTVPSKVSATVTSLVVCNRGAATSFRIAVRPLGATLATRHYLYFDVAIDANTTTIFTEDFTIAPTDVITVYNTDATLTFTAFGEEVVEY